MNLIIFMLIIFTILISIIDSGYQDCKPQSCGSGPSISYPFWVNKSPQPHCGYPGLNVSCYGAYPYVSISNDYYAIHQISYATSSFNVSNAIVYKQPCPILINNFTVDNTPFYYHSSRVGFVYFHYNCTQNPKHYTSYPLGCSGNNSSPISNFTAFYILKEVYDSKKLCQRVVKVAVAVESLDKLSGFNIVELMMNGFLLTWNNSSICTRCEATGGRCGVENNGFICFSGNKTWNWKRKIITGACGAFFGMCLMCVVIVIYYRRKKHQYTDPSLLSRDPTSPSSVTDSVKRGNYKGVQIFTYDELEEATNNFDSAKELGDGGFGTVYYGDLRDGRRVAVKRLYENNFRRVELFMNEVEILIRLRHHNLVSLYGCTSRHSRELLLVYEYIPNGTVADHLHGSHSKTGSLTLPIRISIAMETASALSYLHASDIIHRDVKTNNILLDNNYTVKVADFGLSRLFPINVTHVSTAPQGTPGYVDPEYHQCYQLTDKSDVYSFGVVLIELISSMPAVDITRHRHEINLSNMALAKIQNHALHEIVDGTLGFNTDEKATRVICGVAELAFRCLQGEKEMRPTMDEVMKDLLHVQNDM